MIGATDCLAFGHTIIHSPTANGNRLEKTFIYISDIILPCSILQWCHGSIPD